MDKEYRETQLEFSEIVNMEANRICDKIDKTILKLGRKRAICTLICMNIESLHFKMLGAAEMVNKKMITSQEASDNVMEHFKVLTILILQIEIGDKVFDLEDPSEEEKLNALKIRCVLQDDMYQIVKAMSES